MHVLHTTVTCSVTPRDSTVSVYRTWLSGDQAFDHVFLITFHISFRDAQYLCYF